MRVILLGLFLFAFQSVYADVVPTGCEPLTKPFQQVTLKSDEQRLYYFHNVSKQTIYLAYLSADSEVGDISWTKKITPKNWSALMLKGGTVTFNCVASNIGSEQLIDCRGAIHVCEMKNINVIKEAKGAYWAANNLSLSGVNGKVAYKGIKILPLSKKG